MKYITVVDEREFEIEINDDLHMTIDGVRHELDFQAVGNRPLYSLLIGGHSYEAYVEAGEDGWQVLHRGNLYQVQVEDERAQRLAQLGGGGPAVAGGEYHLKAPMPGLVVTVPVEEEQVIAQGELLVILESMKMQNELKAPRDGLVTRVRVQPGDSIEQNQVLMVISAAQIEA
ncbi:MAG: biotin/lipoyl-containing protein [Anaerolineales bacterium]|nr:biotin/lipoyl-containing protein [Anaerolineales bacterium]